MGAVAVAVVATTGFGAVVAAGPAWVRWPAALGSRCRERLVLDRGGRRDRRVVAAPRRPFAVVALAGILVLVVGGATVGFTVAVARERGRRPIPRAAALGASNGPPVLVVKGFNSQWDGVERRWVTGEFRIRRYSYAGMDAVRPPASVRARRHPCVGPHAGAADGGAGGRARGRDGSSRWASWPRARARSSRSPICSARPGRRCARSWSSVRSSPRAASRTRRRAGSAGVWPPVRRSTPWGPIVERLGPVDVRSDTPLFRSMVEQAPLLQGLLECRVPGVRELAVLPFDSGLAAPRPARGRDPARGAPRVPRRACSATAVTARLVARTLHGRPVDDPAPAGARPSGVVQALASPWQVPSLATSLEPAWRGPARPRRLRRGAPRAARLLGGRRGLTAVQVGPDRRCRAPAGEERTLGGRSVAVVTAHVHAVTQAHPAPGREPRPLVGVGVGDAVGAQVLPAVDVLRRTSRGAGGGSRPRSRRCRRRAGRG